MKSYAHRDKQPERAMRRMRRRGQNITGTKQRHCSPLAPRLCFGFFILTRRLGTREFVGGGGGGIRWFGWLCLGGSGGGGEREHGGEKRWSSRHRYPKEQHEP